MSIKEKIYNYIDKEKNNLIEISDYIFDNPELGGKEEKAALILTNYLIKNEFEVELGIGGLTTAFRGKYSNGKNGPRIGLLCEYDALEGLGHGCGHHMQGPACLGAVVALKNILKDFNYEVIVYGTPAEETFGGKINLIKEGYFKDIDIALMMHGAPDTCTDVKCLALSPFDVIFHGQKSHAALMPEAGKSALDALLTAFNGIEFLREHVKDDVRMHYTISELPGPPNVVPSRAVGTFALRSFSRHYLNYVVERFENIIKGASLISDVTYDIISKPQLDNKIPVFSLNEVIMNNAEELKIPGITPPREKTGSTDFGNVTQIVPGSCIRVQFVPSGTSSHSQQYVDAGKSKEAHDCVIYAAKALAGVSYDIICNKEIFENIRNEFIKNKEIYK
ncbi:M20 family metallopeptidase [Fusobacterium sp. PH5-44]|uniref:M20 family metallopeptidase n=1 Tax=unclassified Fusobacterium TaxID=2648384 RepID=UPI003D1F5F8C